MALSGIGAGSQPGLIETVLCAGVFFGSDNAVRTSQPDLILVGLVRVNRFKYDHK